MCNATCEGINSFGQLNADLPTYPYSAPIVDHVGRYVDSQSTANFQHVGIRTIRARQMRTFPTPSGLAPPRLYIQMGNAVGAYDLNTFFTTRLPAGLKSAKEIAKGVSRGNGAPVEQLVPWDGFVYPEMAESGWYAPLVDQQDPLGKGGPYDLDDRGYVYVGYPTFGWGIARDDGRSNSTHFPKVAQLVSCYPLNSSVPTGAPCANNEALSPALIDPVRYPNVRHDGTLVSPETVISVRSGSGYYLIVAAMTNTHAIFDVTDPALPRLVGTRPGPENAIKKYDRSDLVERVAFIGANNRLYIFTYAELARGGNPLASYTGKDGGFVDVAFDDSGNIWAVESSRLWKLAPAGSGYAVTEYTPFGGGFSAVRAMAVGAGHIAVVGTDRNGTARYDVRLVKIEAGGPRLIATDNFFKNYYHGAAIGYAEPAQYTLPTDLQLIKWNGKTYLMYSALGLGDVFEIQGGDSISATMKTASFGTVNPNAKPTQAGPYPGDMVTFTATSSNAAVSYDVSWEFGNSESGPFNIDLEKTGLDVKHQYTGLDTAAKVTAPKTVRAVAVQDVAISTQLLVSLKLPTPRIGVSSQTSTVAATTTVPLEVVAGSTFKDASDGSVEGHYGIWTIDGVPTKLKPNETIPVGGVGPHTLKFEAFYGKYDASFIGTSPYAAPTISLPYVVKPFRVRLNAPSTVGSNVRFGATPEWTTDPSVMTATQWSVTWSLAGTTSAGGVSTNAAVPPLTGTYNVGVIPHYDVPKVDVLSGSTVSLLIVVDPVGLSVPALPYAQASASSLLTTPDPLIEQAGCANANAPCTFTAKSVGGGSISDWTLLWTVKQGSTTVATSSANPYSPTLPQGTYTVFLKTTKTVFETEIQKSVTVQQSLCGPPPASTSITINPIGCLTSCGTGTTITFAPSYLGYNKQNCDNFSWTFGDGTSGTGEEVTHSYSTPGTKTVTLTISNTAGQVSKNRSITVTGDEPPPPPPPTCTKPITANFSFTGCTGGTCRTTDSLKFTGTKNNGSSLQTCDATAWTFGDNSSSGTKSPSKTFSTPGTYTVSLVVSNSLGTSNSVSKQIVIAAATGGSCSLAPGPGNFAITFTGPESGCTLTNALACKAGEAVAFVSNDYIYPVASCDSFEWDFADGTAKSSVRNPQHVFANNGSYNVQLKVSNNSGSFTYSRPVTITGAAPAQPLPTLTGTFPTAGQKGKVVTFTANSNMATTTGWTWTFGDGTPADTSQAGTTGQSSTITHTFNNIGTFTVTAKARNSTDVASAPLGSTQANITITEAPLIPEYKYLLPVTVHAKGQNNSSWRTDVQIYNPDPAVSIQKPLEMTASFKGQSYNLVVTKATHIYEDFLGRILDHDDQGPVIITTHTAMVAPQIWTRTYNQTEGGGTFGQFIPAIRLDSAGSGAAFGEGKYYLSGLRHDDRYRTNVGFVNPNAVAINATITVRDDRFLAIAQFTRSLQPFQLDQFTLKNLVPSLPTDRPFSLQIEVPPGQWVIGYASFIDSISNDPVFLQAVRESDVASNDHRVSVIPGVGHIGQWRSDVTIFNPDIDPVQFDLEYFDNAGTKLAGATGVFLRSREFLQYSDILTQGVMGASVPEGLGMLKISATTPVPNSKYPMTFARTYFDDGANGTFGQGIVGFSGGRPNVRVNKPAIIAGVRQNASYQTNIGLVNVSTATVQATITLLDPFTGAAASSQSYTLAPNQTIVGSYNGWGSIESGTMKVSADGDVWAFVSIKDKKTNDPEYVPATPVQ